LVASVLAVATDFVLSFVLLTGLVLGVVFLVASILAVVTGLVVPVVLLTGLFLGVVFLIASVLAVVTVFVLSFVLLTGLFLGVVFLVASVLAGGVDRRLSVFFKGLVLPVVFVAGLFLLEVDAFFAGEGLNVCLVVLLLFEVDKDLAGEELGFERSLETLSVFPLLASCSDLSCTVVIEVLFFLGELDFFR